MPTVKYYVHVSPTTSDAMTLAFMALLVEDNRAFEWSRTGFIVKVPDQRIHRVHMERKCVQFGFTFASNP